MVGFVKQIVYYVSIVPENSEVACLGLHRSKSFDYCVRISDTRRVGILGHTPHTLDAFVVSNELFYQIHIGTFLVHRYVYHLDSEVFADCKMSVVSGYGTEEFRTGLIPGLAAAYAELQISLNSIVHKIERAASTHNNFTGIYTEDLRKEIFHLGNTVKHTVVTVTLGHIFNTLELEHFVGNIELFVARLTSCDIYLVALRYEGIVLCFLTGVELLKFFF